MRVQGRMDTLNRQWFVVSTKVRREQFAQDELSRRGILTFLPRIREPGRSLLKPEVAPLFPGYLFVQIELEREYSRVLWAPGVRKFIGFGALPCAVDDDVIGFLRARVGTEGIIFRTSSFKPGDTVRVKQGPLEGLIGIIENPGSSRGRVRVLMELLRRQTRVELPMQIIERISA